VGSYYVPAKPKLISASGMDAVTVFNRVVERSRELGMLPLEADPRRGAFLVFALIETVHDTPRFSMFKIEVHKDGAVEVTPTGFHVDMKTQMMSWKLGERLDWYASELTQVTRITQPPTAGGETL
jgi:hypothetical protein